MNSEIKKKKIYIPSVIGILFIVAFIIFIITLFPYNGQNGNIYDLQDGKLIKKTVTDYKVLKLGILDIFLTPFKGFIDRAPFLVFLLILGVLMHLVIKSKTIDAALGKIIIKLKSKQILLIPIIMTFISILGSIYGFSEETLSLYPILIPLFLAIGFDTITVILMLLLSSAAGVTGSTVNPFSVGIVVDIVNDILGENTINLTSGIVLRLILWITLTAIFIAITMFYSSQVLKNNKKSLTYKLMSTHKTQFNANKIDFNELPPLTIKRILILIVFLLSFAIIITGSLPYHKWGYNGFITFHENIATKWGISALIAPFGKWEFLEYAMIFLISSLIIGMLILREGEKNMINITYEGIKDMVPFIVIVSIASGIAVMLNESRLAVYLGLVFQNMGAENMSIAGYIFIIFAIYFVLSLIIQSTSSMALLTFPFVIALATAIYPEELEKAVKLISITIILYLGAMSSTSFLTPTNILFILPLQQYNTPIIAYYKIAWIPGIITGLLSIIIALVAGYTTI